MLCGGKRIGTGCGRSDWDLVGRGGGVGRLGGEEFLANWRRKGGFSQIAQVEKRVLADCRG